METSITIDHKQSPSSRTPHRHDNNSCGSGKPHSHNSLRGSCGSTKSGIQMNLSSLSTIQVDNVSKHLRTEVQCPAAVTVRVEVQQPAAAVTVRVEVQRPAIAVVP